MQQHFESLAQSLARAWQSCARIPLPDASAAPRSRADAFTIQDRIAAILGDRCVGWKVGAAVRAVQILEGHDGPVIGRLFASRTYGGPATLPGAMYGGYTIESEYAFRFTRALPPRDRPYTQDELDAVVILHAGIEVAGSRYDKEAAARRFTTYDAIADNGSGGAYVLGPAIAQWRDQDLATLPIEGRIDNGAPVQTYTGEYRRDPLDIAVETVNGLASRGIGVTEGDLLSTGSLTVPTPLHAGQTYTARFGDLATVQVTFTS